MIRVERSMEGLREEEEEEDGQMLCSPEAGASWVVYLRFLL